MGFGLFFNFQYTFGDIISFPGRCGQKIFEHFAVYVGPTNQFGQGDRDIFHRIRMYYLN